MATIELYKSKINNMSNYINQAKSAVGDFCVDLSALKSKVLGINSSVCDSVVTSISTSSQTQEQQIAGLEATQREVDEFINLTVNRDNSASSEISRSKKDFYKQYSYLKPDCEKTDWEKFCEGLKKVGQWCKDHWKEIVLVIEIVAAVVCLCVPGLQGINANNLSVIGIYPAKKSNRIFWTKHLALMRKFWTRSKPTFNDRHRLFQA